MHLRPFLASVFGLSLLLAAPARAGEPAPAPEEPKRMLDIFGELFDRIPNLGNLELPGFMPEGMFRLYSSPRFGDLLHRDYLRVPVGARAKLSERVEAHAELESYFTHGLRGNAGYGLDRLRLGAKYDVTHPAADTTALSFGTDFETPLSRPPYELSDGHRHLLPYLSVSRPVFPEWKLLGYGRLGADLLSHTALAPRFGRNQLHTNALTLAAGVARDWPSFNASFTAIYASSALISDEDENVFTLQPAVVIPLRRFEGKRTRLLLTLSARSVWGPDGHEFGTSANLRVEFHFRPLKAEK